jgi:hypothetical protein
MPWPPSPAPSPTAVTDLTVQRTQHAQDHNALAAFVNGMVAGPWQYVNPSGGAAPAFLSPWANFNAAGAGFQVARFRKELGDICRVEGQVAGGANLSTIFTLPLGYRPPQTVRFIQDCGASTTNGISRIDVSATGVINPNFITAAGNVTFLAFNFTFVIDPASL